MAMTYNLPLLEETAIAADGVTVYDAQLLDEFADGFCLVSKVSSRTDGTFTATLQHSPDGAAWFTADACAAQGADGAVIKILSIDLLPYVRLSLSSASVTDGADVEVYLYFGGS